MEFHLFVVADGRKGQSKVKRGIGNNASAKEEDVKAFEDAGTAGDQDRRSKARKKQLWLEGGLRRATGQEGVA